MSDCDLSTISNTACVSSLQNTCKPSQHLRISIAAIINPRLSRFRFMSPTKTDMFAVVKSLPLQTKPAASTLFASSNNFAGKASPVIRTVRFQQASAGDNMEKSQQVQEAEKKGDVMSHSFGEGYATRSDEEGFGGIYGGNQSHSHEDEDDKMVNCNCPEYDKTQGSEVKEKEKARNQTQANC